MANKKKDKTEPYKKYRQQKIITTHEKHIIRDEEKDEHQKSRDCPCQPNMKFDPFSGKKTWIHNRIKE